MTNRRSFGAVLWCVGAVACEREEPRPRPREVVTPIVRPRPGAFDAGAVDVVVAPPTLDAGTVTVATVSERDAGEAPADNRPIDELGLDDLRLIAVVASQRGPSAMVTTPSGHGETLRQGMFVGRAEDGVRWRVATITQSRLRRGPRGELTEAPAELVFERPGLGTARTQRTLTLAPPSGRGEGSIRMTGGGAP